MSEMEMEMESGNDLVVFIVFCCIEWGEELAAADAAAAATAASSTFLSLSRGSGSQLF